MESFKIYNTSNSTPSSGAVLTAVADMIGFVPNVFAVIAESSPALKAFVALNSEFSDSSFDATSREIIQTAEIYKEIKDFQVPYEEFRESIEILDHRGYIEAYRVLGVPAF